ncbi:hypothetical protein X474_00160 [Dethiosulfatarculus sandiegensis]|uniref:Uncharacterized protein n=1 Tax=Dethiosulfatarculus sandiegensis TaxID=1429043 RepID=A0A0D2K399_9BACT|nr:hypothetical protein X474_00160 [Dethiosulfatarculus sandiegensis]
MPASGYHIRIKGLFLVSVNPLFPLLVQKGGKIIKSFNQGTLQSLHAGKRGFMPDFSSQSVSLYVIHFVYFNLQWGLSLQRPISKMFFGANVCSLFLSGQRHTVDTR